jgi:sugar phosphate permease
MVSWGGLFGSILCGLITDMSSVQDNKKHYYPLMVMEFISAVVLLLFRTCDYSEALNFIGFTVYGFSMMGIMTLYLRITLDAGRRIEEAKNQRGLATAVGVVLASNAVGIFLVYWQ